MTMPIGILVESRVLHRGLRGRKTNERLDLYRQIALDEGMLIVVFSISGLQPKKNRVTGYKPTPKGWEKTIIPIPRVIHKRVLFRESSALNKLAAIQRRGVTLVNPQRMQSKATMHNLLSHNPKVKSHLPWTEAYRWSLVEKSIRDGVSILLKPRIGSVGRGIIKIVPYSPGRVRLITRISRIVTLKKLRGYLHANVRSGRYLIQQYIYLARYKERFFDLRVPVQRDGTGTWRIPGIVAKVAGKHPFLTNVAQGGQALPADTVIKAIFDENKTAQIVDDVKSLAFAVAQTVSRTYPHAADLGLDIGVDVNGKAWLIEVNTRDQRITFDEAGLKGAFRSLYRNPLAYCTYLYNASSKGV